MEQGSNKNALESLIQGALTTGQISTEVTTGFLSELVSQPGALILSAGRIVQAACAGDAVKQLVSEINLLRQKAKINDDVFDNHDSRSDLIGILKFIEEENPDEERLKAVKALFLFSISSDCQDSEKLVAHQLNEIAKKISSNGWLVLKAAFELYKEKGSGIGLRDGINKAPGIEPWRRLVAERTFNSIVELVVITEDELVSNGLIDEPSTHRSDLYRDKPDTKFRLTKLGFQLCEFISRGEKIQTADS